MPLLTSSRIAWVRRLMAGLALMPIKTRSALSSANPALSMIESSLVMARISARVIALDANRPPRRRGLDACAVGAGAGLTSAPASLICNGVRPWPRSCCMAWARLAACIGPSTFSAPARPARQRKLDIVVFLRHTQQLVQTGNTGSDLAQAVFIQSVHAGRGGFGVQRGGVESIEDASAHAVVKNKEFVDAATPIVTSLTAMLAAHRLVEM